VCRIRHHLCWQCHHLLWLSRCRWLCHHLCWPCRCLCCLRLHWRRYLSCCHLLLSYHLHRLHSHLRLCWPCCHLHLTEPPPLLVLLPSPVLLLSASTCTKSTCASASTEYITVLMYCPSCTKYLIENIMVECYIYQDRRFYIFSISRIM
jgi:hypothetical protein